ncbi:hypothetical protein JB92DRAFT_2838989 [Gautieria morchelliformis]|nr:hypothetical protein JB92DRAFT_2838989 [Gautieria morchelliformis]
MAQNPSPSMLAAMQQRYSQMKQHQSHIPDATRPTVPSNAGFPAINLSPMGIAQLQPTQLQYAQQQQQQQQQQMHPQHHPQHPQFQNPHARVHPTHLQQHPQTHPQTHDPRIAQLQAMQAQMAATQGVQHPHGRPQQHPPMHALQQQGHQAQAVMQGLMQGHNPQSAPSAQQHQSQASPAPGPQQPPAQSAHAQVQAQMQLQMQLAMGVAGGSAAGNPAAPGAHLDSPAARKRTLSASAGGIALTPVGGMRGMPPNPPMSAIGPGPMNINPNVQRMSAADPFDPGLAATHPHNPGSNPAAGTMSAMQRARYMQGMPAPGMQPQPPLGAQGPPAPLGAPPGPVAGAGAPGAPAGNAHNAGPAHATPPPHAPTPPSAHPHAAPLNPATTRITQVPLANSARTIPALGAAEMEALHAWMERDRAYEAAWRAMRDRRGAELAVPAGPPRSWLRLMPGASRAAVRGGRTRRAPAPGSALPCCGPSGRGQRGPSNPRDVATRREDLVPIRLEIDVEHHKLRETFVWNVNDPLITPEIFAQSIVDDFKLAAHHVHAIAKAVHEQLVEHEHDAEEQGDAVGETPGGGRAKRPAGGEAVDDDDGRARGALDGDGEEWWRSWRKRIRTEDGYVRLGGEESEADADAEPDGDGEIDADAEEELRERERERRRKRKGGRGRIFGVMVPEIMGDVPMDVDDIDVENGGVDEEMRILIKLDILVGSMKLEDQFEWDVGCATNSPEQFATLYTTELGLPGEFTTAIAHQIREQVHAYRKTVALLGAGHVADDDDLRPAFLPPVTRGSVARTVETASAHMPLLNYMSDGEIERTERERDKELKRKRRTARGRALGTRIMPDRTHRTPGIGFPEDSPAVQAAQAASRERGSPVQLGMPEPSRPLVVAAKEAAAKKAAASASRMPPRLFKPPPFPDAVLRPRAKVVAPTPSTGLDSAKYRRMTPKDASAEDAMEEGAAAAQPAVPAKLTAKQLREMEKEAKEKEYAEGQHENMIDGVWHCSNCGCPETIAVGRRKGPLGIRASVGRVFYHRHRRPRQVEYHPEESYHLIIKVEAERAKAVNRRRGGAAALRAMNQEARSAPDSVMNLKSSITADQDDGDDDEDRPEMKDKPGSLHAVPESAMDAPSPADSSSSEEPPLALGKNARASGSATSRTAPDSAQSLPRSSSVHAPSSATPSPPTPAHAQLQQHLQSSSHTAAGTVAPSSTASTKPVSASRPAARNQAQRPGWLKNALDTMQTRYPDDKFDVVLRKNTEPGTPAEWRLYTPGPGETLANFEVHLKNRLHRAKANTMVPHEYVFDEICLYQHTDQLLHAVCWSILRNVLCVDGDKMIRNNGENGKAPERVGEGVQSLRNFELEMRPTLPARSGMPEPKHYIGWWGDMGGPKQKGIITYTLSPFRQRAFAGALHGYIFNGYRRIAANVPYFIVPFALGYGVYSWGTSHYQYLNSKAGHLAALEHGEH